MTMLIGGRGESPQAARPDWFRLQFNERAAVLQRIDDMLANMSDLLYELDVDSSGFLFRNGWLVELLLTMLKRDPQERLPVRLAWPKLVQAVSEAPGDGVAAGDQPGSAAVAAELTLEQRIAQAFPASTRPAGSVKARNRVQGERSGAPAGGEGTEPFRSLVRARGPCQQVASRAQDNAAAPHPRNPLSRS